MSKKIIIIIVFLLSIQICLTFFIYKNFKNINNISSIFQISKSDSTTLLFHDLVFDIDEIKVSDHYSDDPLEDNITKVDVLYHGKYFHREYIGGLYTAYLLDEIMFGQPILVVIRGDGQTIFTNMLAFDSYDQNVHEVSFVDKENLSPDELCCNYVLLIPKNNGIQYDIGMPDFSYKIPKITKYEYKQEKYTFIEKP
ncbi:MAG: hypothetical protein WCP17_00955 [bacterium]